MSIAVFGGESSPWDGERRNHLAVERRGRDFSLSRPNSILTTPCSLPADEPAKNNRPRKTWYRINWSCLSRLEVTEAGANMRSPSVPGRHPVRYHQQPHHHGGGGRGHHHVRGSHHSSLRGRTGGHGNRNQIWQVGWGSFRRNYFLLYLLFL